MNYEIKRQLDILNSKIDRILNAIEIRQTIKTDEAAEKPTKVAKKAPVAKAKKSLKKVSKKKR